MYIELDEEIRSFLKEHTILVPTIYWLHINSQTLQASDTISNIIR